MNRTNEIELLINEFKRISKKRYIRGVNNAIGAIGLTFEKELDKKADSLYFPDYYGTEIKCTSRFSRYPIGLFSTAFDGPTFPEINRLIDKYGYYDNEIKDKKVLFAYLSCIKWTFVKDKYLFKLDIDEKEEKMYLCVKDLETNVVERKSFVYLDSIYNHLLVKLNRLALINASTKKTIEGNFFRYYKMTIYNLIGKEKFLELLKNGVIRIELMARVSKSTKSYGKYKNKDLLFSIRKDDIDKLFKKIYIYDHDANYEKYY